MPGVGVAGNENAAALTCSEHMEFIPGICSELICICPVIGFMFWTFVFPPAMDTVMLMLLYIPCCAGVGWFCPAWLNTLLTQTKKPRHYTESAVQTDHGQGSVSRCNMESADLNQGVFSSGTGHPAHRDGT